MWVGGFLGIEGVVCMKFNEGASHLSESDWNLASRYLSPLEGFLRDIADSHSLKFGQSERWPEFQLCQRSGTINESLRIGLNYNFMQDKQMYFEINFHRFSRRWFAPKRVDEYEKVKLYSVSGVENVEGVVSEMRCFVKERMS